MNAIPVITIDGPSASGKGTVAARVAQRLGFHYLDSGALYRVVAFAARGQGVAWDDEKGLTGVARDLAVEFQGSRVMLDGQDVTDEIRTELMSQGASQVAPFPRVRARLLARQQAFARPPGLVAEGRDMGSVVFPDADLKIYLTASVEARAERRHKQLIDKGIPVNIQGLLLDLRERDARDASRAAAPLVQSPDAQLLDTTAISVEAAVEAVLRWFRKRSGQRRSS